MPVKTKMLAWAFFLMFFIEAGTLGLFPRSLYFVYRNVRLSDIIMYGLVVYSVFNIREFLDLYKSKAFIIVKLMLFYVFFQFIVSVIQYKVDVIEYFFRLKALWMSLLVLPYFLLLKRGGVEYLIKIILPVAVVSNVFYIISSFTGVALLPDVSIVQQDLPGGIKIFRVFGGTFFGDFFFLGLIFYWNQYKFKLIHVPFIILFALPHVLSFGRNSWITFTFAVIFIIIWSSYRKQDITTMIKQLVIITAVIYAFIYFFNQFIPQSEDITEAIESRIQQGKDDFKYSEGTIGTRLANIDALIMLWYNNPVIGVGMHPMWVIQAETTEEIYYAWGFADVRWAGVLAGYGTIGFLLAIIFQLYYMIGSFKLLKKIKTININYYFLLIFLIYLLRDSFINYVYLLTTTSLTLLGPLVAFHVANYIYLYEKYKDVNTELSTNGKNLK